MKHEKTINRQRCRRRFRVRNRIKRDAIRPRMSVVRSLKHMSVQIIDDEQGVGSIERVTADGDIGGVTVTATAQSP